LGKYEEDENHEQSFKASKLCAAPLLCRTSPPQTTMRWTTGLIAVVALAASADAFHVSAPGKARGIAGPQAARPLRAPGATKLAMGPSLWNEVCLPRGFMPFLPRCCCFS
jgi:hypothetical protein